MNFLQRIYALLKGWLFCSAWCVCISLNILSLDLLLQSLLLSKTLKMQQDDEDRKHEIIIKGLEDKVKQLEDSLKEKDKMLCSAEGSLAEAQTQNKN